MLKTVLKRYKTDKPFKAGVALVRGAGVDTVYAIFRLITGIIYSSIWFITLAVYHLVLGVIRLFLLRSYGIAKRKTTPGEPITNFPATESRRRLCLRSKSPSREWQPSR